MTVRPARAEEIVLALSVSDVSLPDQPTAEELHELLVTAQRTLPQFLVAGVVQLNIRLPLTVSGTVPVVVTTAGASSQATVTVAVK